MALNVIAAEVTAVPLPVVLMAAGAPVPVACKVNWSDAATRPAPPMAFCRLIVGGLAVLVKVQMICAAATTLATGMVSVLPLRVPKLAGFPVRAELASVQLAAVTVKVGLAVSVIVTAAKNADTVLAVGEAGAAVPIVDVEIFAGVVAKLVFVKLKGPPIAPNVIFLTATVAGIGVLVKVQAMASP